MFFQFPPPPKKPTSQLKFWTAAVQNHIGGQTPFSTWGLTAGQLLLTAACWFELAVHRSLIFVLTLQYGESLFSFLRNLSTSSFNTFLRFFTTRLKPKNTFLLYPCHLPAPPLPHSCSTLVTFLLLHPCHTFAPTDLPMPQLGSSVATAPHPLFPVTLLQLCSSYNTWPLFTLPLLLPFLCHNVSSDLPLFSCCTLTSTTKVEYCAAKKR